MIASIRVALILGLRSISLKSSICRRMTEILSQKGMTTNYFIMIWIGSRQEGRLHQIMNH